MVTNDQPAVKSDGGPDEVGRARGGAELAPKSRLLDWITAAAPPDRVNLVAVTDQDSEERSRAC